MELKVKAPYDPGFYPMVKFVDEFNADVAKSEKQTIAVSVIRNQGYTHTVKMDVFKDGIDDERNCKVVERIVKTFLWVYGGYKIVIAGSKVIYEHIAACYAKDGVRAFDNDFMAGVYEKPFEVEYLPCPNCAPKTNESASPVGRHLDGCRIGFDAGGSDVKVSAVIDGESVYSEEIVWHPKLQTDPNYHYNGIRNAMLKAADEGVQVIGLEKMNAGRNTFESMAANHTRMQEEAGNQYMDGQVEFDIRVLAGQLSSEKDSFGNTYDALAAYPGTGYAPAPEQGISAVEIPIRNEADAKVGSVVIPAQAVADGVSGLNAYIEKTEYNGNFTIGAGMEKQSFEITVDGLKENNDVPVKASVRVEAGKDPSTFELYHYDTKIPCSYNPSTGYVTFETTTFSPFTVVYDADSVYVAPGVSESDLPQATVEAKPEYVNVDLPWESYGSWSPTEGLDSKLEAAYEFKCAETFEQAKENPYANWYCDFYVVLDKDLGANQIFLGGNYGSFGWIGFHNGDLTLDANTELPLLGSVTTNPWTYLDVVQSVGTFTCGVGDVNNALSGATFKVMLRLTNPDDANDFVNVATITHTFQ